LHFHPPDALWRRISGVLVRRRTGGQGRGGRQDLGAGREKPPDRARHEERYGDSVPMSAARAVARFIANNFVRIEFDHFSSI
jgi:hypothetical protein